MKRRIQICMGSSCFSRGNGINAELLQRMADSGELDAETEIVRGADGAEISGSLCAGLCKDGPIVVVDGVVHKRVGPMTLKDLLSAETE